MSEVFPIWDEALAIDVDRCLVNVDACTQNLQVAYDIEGRAFNLPALDLVKLQEGVESTLNSFSPYSVVREVTRGNDEAFNKVFDRFVQLGRHDQRLVYSDTHPFIDYLTQSGKPFYLNTRGTEFEWQRYKVAAAALGSLPIAMTMESDKGTELERTRIADGRGGYCFSPQNILLRSQHFALAARRITGVDDYKSNLRNWPADCRAFWLDRLESRTNKKQIEQASVVLPANVQRVTSLMEIIYLLNAKNR